MLLIQLDDGGQAIISSNLDTLIKTKGQIKLIDNDDYATIESENYAVYRAHNLLFKFNGNNITKISPHYFLILANALNCIFNSKGDTLYKSRKAIKYIPLANQFLLDDGEERLLYDNNDKVVYRFQKTPYVVSDNKDLIIKDDNSVTIFRKNETQEINFKGKFVKATTHYLILDVGKYKQVYRLDGSLVVSKTKQVKALTNDYVSYKLGKNYFIENVTTQEKTKVKSLNITITDEGLDYEDLNQSMETIVFKPTDSLTIFEHNKKFGLKLNNKTVLPCAFFQIEPFGTKFLVQDKIEYKLFNRVSNSFINSKSYNAVSTYGRNLVVTKNGETTYLNFDGKIIR
jgi:hypothetical protein